MYDMYYRVIMAPASSAGADHVVLVSAPVDSLKIENKIIPTTTPPPGNMGIWDLGSFGLSNKS